MRRTLPLILIFALTACGERTARNPGMTAPNPDGCYVRVWDANGFSGDGDFINGPARYTNLRDLPGGRVWTNRIRSLRAGPSATVTVWADENFQGQNLRVRADAMFPRFADGLAGEIKSMQIDCASVRAE